MGFRKRNGSFRGEAGQVLLIVILVTIVASTVGLSLASRTITNLRTSTEEAESQKALSAAEAGLERAIQGSVPISVSNPNVMGSEGKTNSLYNTKVQSVQSAAFLINGGNVIPKDEGADVWFVEHNSDGTLNYGDYSMTSPEHVNLYWGLPSESCYSPSNMPAAIQVIAVTRDSTGVIKTYRYAYDSCSRGNNFTLADAGKHTVSGITEDDGKTSVTFGNKTPDDNLTSDIKPPNRKNIIFMRVIPIYRDTIIGVSTCSGTGACSSLSKQGYKITSIGQSGEVTRKLTVFKGYPQIYLPYISYGLFVAAD